jgi:hypothetical protein
MRPARLVKMAGIGLLGVAGGLVVSVAALIGVVFLALWLTQDSPSTHARKEVQSMFDGGGDRTAIVKTCQQIGNDEQARIYRCRVAAPGCIRAHRFAVYRDRGYGAAPYAVSADVIVHPCRYPSD